MNAQQLKAGEAHTLRLKLAWERGYAAAEGLKIGDVFGGAWYHAGDFGYWPDSEERAIFTQGFIAALPAVIVTDDSGVLVEYI